VQPREILHDQDAGAQEESVRGPCGPSFL
jgi:hypothetical protein